VRRRWLIGGAALVGLQLPWIAPVARRRGRRAGLPAVAITSAIAAAAGLPALRPRPARVRSLAGVY